MGNDALTTERGRHTYEEITSQPEVWAQTLTEAHQKLDEVRAFLAQGMDDALFIGCGSTYYLALAAASLLQRLAGWRARGLPSSELWFYPEAVLGPARRPLLVAVSRSGTTTETLRAMEAFKAHGGSDVAVVTCYPDTPMAQVAQVVLSAPAAQEKSIAQTRSFASMYVLTQVLAGLAAGDDAYLAQLDRLPDAGRALLDNYSDLAERLGSDLGIDRAFFLGSGIYYGLACETMLKMKEMSLTYAEAFHFLEFRHGPKSMVNESTLVIGMVSDSAREHEVAVLREMRGLGARVLAIAEEGTAEELGGADFVVTLNSGLPETARGVLYLPLLQLMAYHRSMAKELDPDRPRNLDLVVHL
ncbi:MAG TPA: SIS domain-containing protein [Caldilineae bacterium]|nr:SIS domain-containing protein [Caldilineae bacterium]